MVHRRSKSGNGEIWRTRNSPNIPCSPCISQYPSYWTIGRVKFGVPLEQVCKNDIPGPLLVLILKLNKEGPNKKDVFRAPGHQASIKKLIHFLQNGRLVNIDNFSVYTIASVLKKFLRKLPDGIFGRHGEEELFRIIEMTDMEQQRDYIHRLITSMCVTTQHLLVLLFGTFRVIAMSANRAQTGMTSEALGVSVAPSFFQSCVADGKTACMEDVFRFKVATQIMKFLIDNFGVSNLFGRSNYEYYARITGRILKVEEDWIFAFSYPSDNLVARQYSIEAEKSWLQYESDMLGLKINLEAMSEQEESQSTPALIHIPESSSDGMSGAGLHGACASPQPDMMISVPENTLRESCTRLSISLEENGLYKVHERQTERMRTRSEWFLSPSPTPHSGSITSESQYRAMYVLRPESINRPLSAGAASYESVGSGSGGGPVRRSSSKDKDSRRLVRRSSSKKDKENGQKGARSRSTLDKGPPGTEYVSSPRRRGNGASSETTQPLTDNDCIETDVHRVHSTHVYKPRI